MTDAPSSENMTLRVENLGPIIEADIELRPLTVFAGPGNTGKSWLATLIYALHKHFESVCNTRTGSFIDRLINEDIPKKEVNALIDRVNSEIFSKKKGNGKRAEQRIDLPDFIMRNISEYLDESNKNIIRQICRSFGIENEEDMIRNVKNCDHMSFSIEKTIHNRGSFHQHSDLKGKKFKNKISKFPKVTSVDIDDLVSALTTAKRIIHRGRDELDSLWQCDELLSVIANRYIYPWFDPLSKSAFYFPADRAGVMHNHRSIVRAIVSDTASTGLISTMKSTTRLSGIMADFLQQIINIDPPSYHNKASSLRHSIENHGIEIEKNILGGKIGIERSPLIGYPEFTFQPKGWKKPLPLNNASSMVSELAPIVLFLRHKVTKGNTLIIEEPEARLHPEMQVELTLQLASLVQSGVRVILITHSEWVLQTIANMICASDLNNEQRSNIPTAKIALDEDQVGAWLFKQKKSPRGSIVKRMSLDRETGLYDSDYEAVTENLYGDSTSIYNEAQRSLSA